MADFNGPENNNFSEWVDSAIVTPFPEPLPLTHITKALIAHRIIDNDAIAPNKCPVFGDLRSYLFYGRPAFRYDPGKVIKLEASSPFCFIMSGNLLGKARYIYPFDTGAFKARMYNHILDEDFDLNDFCMGSHPDRAEKLISAAYLGREAYLRGDRRQIVAREVGASAYQLEAGAYLELLRSSGRNEPDDRIGTIEVQFTEAIPLRNNLLAVIAPDSHWRKNDKSPFLKKAEAAGAHILPYEFVPGRHFEHYHSLIEHISIEFCKDQKLI